MHFDRLEGLLSGPPAACAECLGKKFPGIEAWGALVRRHAEAQTESTIETEGGERAPVLP